MERVYRSSAQCTVHIGRHTERETDRQTDRQSQVGRQTYRETDGQTERQRDNHRDRYSQDCEKENISRAFRRVRVRDKSEYASYFFSLRLK